MSSGEILHNWMSDGAIAWIGLLVELLVAAAYGAAARKRSPRGFSWPVRRTAAFFAGLLVLAVALDSGIAAHDDIPWVHVLQHALLMTLAPILLVIGAPITLTMRTISRSGRRRLLALLHDPSVHGLVKRPAVLVLDYNAAMALVLLAPIYRLAEGHLVLHIAIHAYVVFCGLLFWAAVLARDPIPARLSKEARIRAVAISVPINATFAAAVMAAPGVFIGAGQHAATTSAEILVIASTATSLLGVAIVAAGRTPIRASVARWMTRGRRGGLKGRGQTTAAQL